LAKHYKVALMGRRNIEIKLFPDGHVQFLVHCFCGFLKLFPSMTWTAKFISLHPAPQFRGWVSWGIMFLPECWGRKLLKITFYEWVCWANQWCCLFLVEKKFFSLFTNLLPNNLHHMGLLDAGENSTRANVAILLECLTRNFNCPE